jgi:glyoxylase-like metal-dependent hydrolase (beta-lactamase superfamily II)
VHVEADDPTSDWTREGVFEVEPGVYRIPLPLPNDGLRAVNVYAIAEDDEHGAGLVLVDSGWAIDAARDALDKALAALDHEVRDVRRFLVTHVHRDHYGLAVAIRREFGNHVSLGAGERPTIEALTGPDHRPLGEHLTTLARCGAHDLVAWIQARTATLKHDPTDWAPPDDWLDGTDIELASRTLSVVPTPGHTRGHVVFVDPSAGLLFAGDHVLPHITPSIGFEGVPAPLPLGDYMDSLRLVRQMPDRRLLPAHGPVKPSTHERIDELLDHHVRRLDEALALVGGEVLTAYETAERFTWTRRRRSFAELDPFNQMLAVTETGAHLDLLVAQGRLRVQEIDAVRRYEV